jgi:hypothetical protein
MRSVFCLQNDVLVLAVEVSIGDVILKKMRNKSLRNLPPRKAAVAQQ